MFFLKLRLTEEKKENEKPKEMPLEIQNTDSKQVCGKQVFLKIFLNVFI